MSTAALVIGILLVILSMSAVVLSALISFKTVESTNLLVSSMHERAGKQLDKTLDRLMTINWEQFSVMQQGLDSSEWGYQSLPRPAQAGEDEDQPDQLAPDLWDKMRSIIDDTHVGEEELIAEDLARDEAVRRPQ